MKNAIMTNESNGHQIRRAQGQSSHFRGGRNDYGRYMWDIKYHDFRNEFEMESAQSWAFGEYVRLKTNNPVNGNERRGFDGISELLERPIESGTAGRSGGWLVIDTELTEEELAKVDAHVESCMRGLPEFLKEEREFRASEEQAAIDAENETRERLSRDTDLAIACRYLQNIAGTDIVLTVSGISIDVQTGMPVEKEGDKS